MSRRLRYVPRPMVVEVTCRTIHGRFLLDPSPRLNRLVVGILARAQRKYGVRIHAFCVMSNHYHLLITVTDAQQLARFMNFVPIQLGAGSGTTGAMERTDSGVAAIRPSWSATNETHNSHDCATSCRRAARKASS